MSLTSFVTLLSLGASALIAGRVGGRMGLGILLGATLGAAVALIGVLWVRHALIYRPERALRAQVEMFLVKLGAVVACAFAFRFLEPVARIADWRAVLVAYVSASLAILLAGAAMIQRLARERREARKATVA